MLLCSLRHRPKRAPSELKELSPWLTSGRDKTQAGEHDALKTTQKTNGAGNDAHLLIQQKRENDLKMPPTEEPTVCSALKGTAQPSENRMSEQSETTRRAARGERLKES